MIDDKNTDDFLEHFGVKGMKWGQRKARDDSSPTPRQQRKAAKEKNRELNKAAERKEAARIIEKSKSEKNPVEAARMRTYSGANSTRLKEAKEKYKAEKVEKGSFEARRALDQVKREVQKDYVKSQEYKDGSEFVNDLFGAMAGVQKNEFATEAERYRKYRDV